MADHAINNQCIKDRSELASRIKAVEKDINGNGRTGLFKRVEIIEDDYITKDEFKKIEDIIPTLATKADIHELRTAIEKKFVRKSENKRGLLTIAKAFGVAILSSSGAIVTALIMKG